MAIRIKTSSLPRMLINIIKRKQPKPIAKA